MKKLLIFATASIMALSLSGCGKSKSAETKKEDSTAVDNNSSSTTSGDNTSDTGNTDVPMITNEEVNELNDNQLYVANAMSSGITELYISKADSDEWTTNYVTSTVTSGSRTLMTFDNVDTTAKYNVKVVTESGEKTEYYGFDIKATVQITLYDNAQCDVATI